MAIGTSDKIPPFMKRILLITGSPRSGKTTPLSAVAGALAHVHPSGFLTTEIREGGIRNGFLLKDLGGKQTVLANSSMESRYRAGRYGVDIAGFDCFQKETFSGGEYAKVFIIDEIGKMECFSAYFRDQLS
jgi:nucleoside-triphosphatase